VAAKASATSPFSEAGDRMTLVTLPTSMRVLFTCFMTTIGMGYLMAVFYLFLVDVDPHEKMGMGVAGGITMKYRGQQGNTRLEAALRGSMADRLQPGDREDVQL